MSIRCGFSAAALTPNTEAPPTLASPRNVRRLNCITFLQIVPPTQSVLNRKLPEPQTRNLWSGPAGCSQNPAISIRQKRLKTGNQFCTFSLFTKLQYYEHTSPCEDWTAL